MIFATRGSRLSDTTNVGLTPKGPSTILVPTTKGQAHHNNAASMSALNSTDCCYFPAGPGQLLLCIDLPLSSSPNLDLNGGSTD